MPSQLGSVLTAADGAANDYFGHGAALSGDGLVLAVGAFGRQSGGTDRGGVYIYDFVSNAWVARGSVITAPDGADNDIFGYSCALNSSGNVLAIGAIYWEGGNVNEGSVYVYDWSGSAWSLRGSAPITAGSPADNDNFGASVSLSENGLVLVVGAFQKDNSFSNQGAVYTYDWSGSAWVQRGGILYASGAAADDSFGLGVSVSGNGNVLAVSAYSKTNTQADQGGVYIYDVSGSNWNQRGGVIYAGDAIANANFGYRVSLNSSGSLLSVGATNRDGAIKGGVYFYKYNGSSWQQEGSFLAAGDGVNGDWFGSAVSFQADGNKLVVSSFARSSGFGGVYTYSTSDLSGLVANQGSITFTGQIPSVTTPFSGTPFQGGFEYTGLTPAFPTPFTGSPTQGGITFTGLTPQLFEDTIPKGTLTGTGFTSEATFEGEFVPAPTLTGGGFIAPAELFGGGFFEGGGFSALGVLDGVGFDSGALTGNGFVTEVVFTGQGIHYGTLTGNGFTASGELFGGGELVGGGFVVLSESVGEELPTGNLLGAGFVTEATLTGIFIPSGVLTGGGFVVTETIAGVLTGGSFVAAGQLTGTGLEASLNAAFVMNIKTNQVSQYTNYPFLNIIPVNGKYYGVKLDGLYLIDGDNDNDPLVKVNGTIRTKDDDFGNMYSQNIPYAYIGNDDKKLTIQPIVDGNELYPAYPVEFNGRRTRLGRGIKGRYWSLKIEHIENIHNLELMPDKLKRKVK